MLAGSHWCIRDFDCVRSETKNGMTMVLYLKSIGSALAIIGGTYLCLLSPLTESSTNNVSSAIIHIFNLLK